MVKKWIVFLIGVIIFLSSLPLTILMAMEKIHTSQMHNRYELHIISHRYPPPESTFHYKNNIIEVKETLLDEENYTDPWNYKIAFADLSVFINGEEIDTLEQYPIRMEEEGLARYYGNISSIIIKDKRKDEEKLYMILKKTKDPVVTDGINIGIAPVETLTYSLYDLDEDGLLGRESFSFTNRNALQTLLLNNSGTSPHAIGHYTDAWNWMPSVFYPFIFPFLSFLVGIVLLIFYFPFRKSKSRPL
ncbi:hypothetical protein MHZ92_04405 [Sporosarcina sp. ACRSL]|uniref:hypothetical protein n=1 Tax=Sporosarcina sp. ACRSL TaxID=2918215 RepID=UPI001EF40BA2|nr:hypothetical protein [Sporosarcina sp. ACRSL]MCG7343359.1 hypothetical protein [Sporosarcina sp. ACRSL]